MHVRIHANHIEHINIDINNHMCIHMLAQNSFNANTVFYAYTYYRSCMYSC